MIKYVYHLADLHFRNLRRHDEYRGVLNGFLRNVDSDGYGDSAIIYIAGDIAHAKTEMSPELVKEISWFLSECAKRTDTFIIAGNHDFNVTNPNRLDVITPIVENLSNPKIHYLKNSGITNYKNLALYVYSLMGSRDDWPNACDGSVGEGCHKICLFHGAVDGSKTDVGYVIQSDKYKLSMFDGFDYALLGDIHKRNFLQMYSKVGDVVKPSVAYSSSVIQQDYGEAVNGHGYILWNLDTREGVPVDLYNEFAYITINAADDVYPSIDSLFAGNVGVPKKIRCRIKHEKCTVASINQYVSDLKKVFTVVDLSIVKTSGVEGIDRHSMVTAGVDNVHDSAVRRDVITKHATRRGCKDGVTVNDVLEYHDYVEQNVKFGDFSDKKAFIWKPVKFTFSNMFSYGEDNEINFDDAVGIVGIFAPNAHGKTSIIEALTYCVYGKTNKTSNVRNIMNTNKDWFECALQFKIDGVDYYIERKTKQSKSGTIKSELNFWLSDRGDVVSLNGVSTKETNAKIQEYVGGYDDFVLTALSSQNNNSLFFDKGQADKKDTLSKFMGLDVFEVLHTFAHNEYKEQVNVAKRLENKIASANVDINSLADRLRTGESMQIDIEAKIRKYNQDLNELRAERDVMLSKKQSVPFDISGYDVNMLTRKKGELESKLKTMQAGLVDCEGSIAERLDEVGRFESEIVGMGDYAVISDNCERCVGIKAKSVRVSDDIAVMERSVAKAVKELEDLTKYRYNESCDVCVANNSVTNDRKNELREYISTTQDAINIAKQQYNSYLGEIQGLERYVDAKKHYDGMLVKMNTAKNEHSQLIVKKSNIELAINKVTQEITDVDGMIAEYNQYLDIYDANKLIDVSVSKLDAAILEKNNSVESEQASLMNVVRGIGVISEQIKVYRQELAELDLYKQRGNVLASYVDLVNRNGIPYTMIEDVVPILEREVNNILHQIVDFTISIEMDDKNILMYIMYNGKVWDMDMASGMERFVSGLAMRLALINVCNLPKPNFLIIDEGFGVLDSDKLASTYMLMDYLKNRFEFVLVVSHIDSMRDIVDDLIEITKDDYGYSSVLF